MSVHDGRCDYNRFAGERCKEPGLYGSPQFEGVSSLTGSTQFVRDSRWCSKHRQSDDCLVSKPTDTTERRETGGGDE